MSTFVDAKKTEQYLYRSVQKLPIIDFHNHLNVAELYADKKYPNITQMWISSDPYKHRIMRILGVPEHLITGDADDEEKFMAFCRVFPMAAGTPVYDWAREELKTLFGTELLPSEENEKKLWKLTGDFLSENGAASIISRFSVEYAAPCASLTDDLSLFGKNGIYPSLRGDNLLAPTAELVGALSGQTGMPIKGLTDYLVAIDRRLADFQNAGCFFADHAVDSEITLVAPQGEASAADAARLFDETIKGKKLDASEKNRLFSYLLFRLAGFYSKYGMALQLHIGAERYTSARLRRLTGPAGGYAGCGGTTEIGALTAFLAAIEDGEYGLPRVILYNLNPADNAAFSILSGSYSIDGCCGGVVNGAAWWWNDHRYGIRSVLENTMAYSVLSVFPGMVTDSRSVASFVRHDYFRKILCAFLAEKAAEGALPEDLSLLEAIAKKMCYENAKDYIRMKKEK